MTREQQAKFLDDLLAGFTLNLKARVQEIPEDWDGIELRQWVVDMAAQHLPWHRFEGKRKRDYKREVITRNLV